ncbi:protein sip5 [Anaeramoeba flamelloides]|uniref:Protein sip5 n=1 Tax=Anaeramoeba flamelloides TaxID=1746091 RepID=A0AAV7Z5Z2_9EUKA|nr:protein sip5 [Anaeramoeba flamelloides]
MGSKGSKHKKTTQKVTFKKARKKLSQPTYEIYSEVKWKKSKVKKAIRKKRLAPIFSPNDDQDKFSIVECPICSYFFPIANITTCCKKPICTECYLQICPHLNPCSSDRCPWCRHSNFSISYEETYRKKFLKQLDNEFDDEMLELEKKAQENEREEFEREREKIRKTLLEIKEKEKKEGEYEKFQEMEKQKQKQRELTRLMFEQQKRNDQNPNQNNFNFNNNVNNIQIFRAIEEIGEMQQNEQEQQQEQEELELELEQEQVLGQGQEQVIGETQQNEQEQEQEQENQEEQINLNNIFDYLRNTRRVSQLQANQFNDLMVEQAIRLSTQQN